MLQIIQFLISIIEIHDILMHSYYVKFIILLSSLFIHQKIVTFIAKILHPSILVMEMVLCIQSTFE
jgi:hypothetical protein